MDGTQEAMERMKKGLTANKAYNTNNEDKAVRVFKPRDARADDNEKNSK